MSGSKIKKGLKQGIGVIFEYETQKIVQISSKKVGIIYRLIQIIIISYVVGWVMIYKKSYQEFDKVVSGITTKVKGIQFTDLPNTTIGSRIWDVADYVVPPQENNAFFIMTNTIITPDQKQGKCDEDPGVPGAQCISDKDCLPVYKPIMLGNGVTTGKCINSTQKPNTKVCEIYSWCPVEIDKLPAGKRTIFPEAVNFTVLIKNSIRFPKFKVKRRNVLDTYNASHLTTCLYQRNADLYCPVFKIGSILNYAEPDPIGFDKLAAEGGVVSINIDWDCNLDWSETFCNPVYSFSRLDDEDAKIAKGWNFRYANYYSDSNGTQYRTLVKAYGIRFIVYVTGVAGKFNVIPLTMALGSGLALLGIASILCDMIVLYLLSKKGVYRDAKYEQLEDDDAYHIMEEEGELTHSQNAVNRDKDLKNVGAYGATSDS